MSLYFITHSDSGLEPVNVSVAHGRMLGELMGFLLNDETLEEHWIGDEAQFILDRVDATLADPDLIHITEHAEYVTEILTRVRPLVQYAVENDKAFGYM